MNETANENRYDIIPVSDLTKENMTLKNDDWGHFNRMLMLQDEFFEEKLEALESKITDSVVKVLTDYNKNILKRLDTIQSDLGLIKDDIKKIKRDVFDLYKDLNNLKNKVSELEKMVMKLETKIECP